MRLSSLLSVIAVSALSGCGGGGGGGGAAVTPEPVTYTAAASKGELVQYEIDTKLMTYKYTILSSAYNLPVNTARTGVLTYNATDDTYNASGLNGKIAFNSAGLLFGVIKEDFGAGAVSVPVFGLSTLEKQISNIADTYNYVSYQCSNANVCAAKYGTIKIDAGSGTWQACELGNLGVVNPGCARQVSGNGKFDSASGKLILLDASAVNSGTAISFVKDGQKVLVIDLNGGNAVLGKGMVVASAQNNAPSSMDGTWRYIRTSETGRLTISGTTITQSIDGGGSGTTTFTANTPWTGFARTANGNVALAAGSGMYAASFVDGNFSVGLKK
jgi:hypothetical protein